MSHLYRLKVLTALFFHRKYFLLGGYNDDVMQNGPSEWDNTTLELSAFRVSS